jgi:co-chaperonin GroES (HSP10)
MRSPKVGAGEIRGGVYRASVGARTVGGIVHMRSAVVGSGATVVVAVGVFLAVSAGNAAEPEVVETPAVVVVGHYSTTESQDSIVYVPEPVVEAPPADIPVEVVPVTEPSDPTTPPAAPIDVPPENLDLGTPPPLAPEPGLPGSTG